ncbi:hypothetical protein ABZO35_31055 [Burkholderia pseudomallei]|uniref:amidohydrolase family protein n=1 Tax=Burkholderia pseudomallei TaxID=28450 RepID=UPI00344DFF21
MYADTAVRHRTSEWRAFSGDPKAMQAIRSGACWVIEHATYFDGDRHIWREADIEICAGEIVRVCEPGTSRASIRRDARGLLCLPGLVSASLNADGARANLYDNVRQAIASGFTTIGIFSDNVTQDVQTVSAFGNRPVFYHVLMDRWLGRGHRPVTKSTDACIHGFRQTLRNTSGSRISVFPAIGSQFGASPALLIALHEIAKDKASRLVIRLDGGGEGFSDFHDAYGCSSASLLSNLGVLDQHLLAFPVSSLNRVDWRLLNASACAIVACDAHHWNSVRRRGYSAIDREFATRLFAREQSADWRYQHEEIIDMLTWKGAASLALDNLGKIAVGQRADLLLYAESTHAASLRGQSASDLFMRCVTRSRPLAVYVDGQPVASAGHV